jgi:hypothetical protein
VTSPLPLVTTQTTTPTTAKNWTSGSYGMAAMEDRQFCSLFGAHIKIVVKVWFILLEDGLRPKKSKPKHLLWMLYFLRFIQERPLVAPLLAGGRVSLTQRPFGNGCGSSLSTWYGASLGGPLCHTHNNLTLRLFSHTCLHTMSDDNQTRPKHTTQRPTKHHHHGGGAANPSGGMDLMNPRRLRGGRPCA